MGLLRLVLVGCLFLVAGFGGGPEAARAQDLGRVVSPILTIDRDGLFAGTLYGQRVNRELETARAAMAEETRNIQAALEAEELALTEQRATLPADEFRGLADAFDEKVQSLREERAAAEALLVAQIEAAQAQFFNEIGAVLGRLVRERGAVAIVDARAILLVAADIDITEAAIERIDSALGDGSNLDGGNGTAETDANGANGSADSGIGLDIIPAPEEPAPAEAPASEN